MKKNIYLIIITIITVVCIIAGSLYHIGGFALDLFENSSTESSSVHTFPRDLSERGLRLSNRSRAKPPIW